MKSKQTNTSWGFRIFLLLVFLGTTSLTAFAMNDFERIPLDGNWLSRSKSVIHISVSASICNSVIFIQNRVPDRDMTICLLNEQGTVVYEEEISKSETASVIIHIDNLPKGEYVLEISSMAGDWLRGSFEYK